MKNFSLSKMLLAFILMLPNINFSQETYLDQFNIVSYSENNGTSNFSSDWIEVNESASDPFFGVILVVSNALRLRNADNAYIYRELDLSGTTSVTFTLDYDATGARGEFLELYFYDDATGDYEFHSLINTADNSGSISVTLSGSLLSANSGVSFRGDGVWAANAEIFLDNVQFTATFSSSDTDGDGIADSSDLDDDNDGILDDLECDASGTSLGDSNTVSGIVYFQDFEGIPRLGAPLLNDGSEGFTTDLFHFSEMNFNNDNPGWNVIPSAVPDGSEYIIASDADGLGNVIWPIATNGTIPVSLPSIISEPTGDFFLVNSFGDTSSSRNANSLGIAFDDNDGDGNTGEIFSVDNIRLDRNGVYDFAVFITDITNAGNNNNFYNFEVFDAVSGSLIASVTNGVLPLDDQWHLTSLEFFITDASFSVGNVNREVNLAFRQNVDLGFGADIGIDNVFLAYRALDTDEDGIANCEDLDSDGDGCPDAFEGGASFTNGDLAANYNMDGGPTDVFYNLGLGTDSNNDGVLDLVGAAGQSIGSSQDNSISNCPLVIDFDGVDDVIKAPSSFDISSWNATTIQFWVKSNTTTQTNAGIIGQEGVIEITYDGAVSCKLFSQGIEKNFNNPSWLASTTNWEHFTLVYNQGTIQVYHNGDKEYEEVNLSLGALSNSTNSFNIGGLINSSGVSNFFNGWIDEVRVFDVALTETQIQQTIYQEIENNGGYVHGVVIPKDIEDLTTGNKISWANLRLYYKMNDSFVNRQVEDVSQFGENGNIFNIYTQQEETAPIPYTTSNDGSWTSQNTWLHGDVWDIENLNAATSCGIVRILNNITVNENIEQLGLIIDSGSSLTVEGDHLVENNWYLELNGTIDLLSDSQLIQGLRSDLVTSSDGKILRRQEGQSNVYRYNYWSSPVGAQLATSLINENTSSNNPNNTDFTLNMLKDASGNPVQFTNDYDQDGLISNYWLYTYINGITYRDWAGFNESSPLVPGLGYTQKGGGSLSQYIFEGKPNNGTILLSASDVGGLGSVGGVSRTEYLVGNPYPSAIDAHQFIADNSSVISGTIYLWEQWGGNSHFLNDYQGGYATLNLMAKVRAYQFIGLDGAATGFQGGVKTPTQFIPVAQSFMVEVVSPSGDIQFNNGQRVFRREATGESLFFKTNSNAKTKKESHTEIFNKDVIQKIKLEFIANNGLGREIVLGFSNLTTDGFDYGYDAIATETFVNDLIMPLNNLPTVIQGFSSITPDKKINLSFQSDGVLTYSIAATEVIDFPQDQEVYLLDNYTGTYHDLKSGLAYKFTSDKGVFNDRFDIVFQTEQALSNDEFSTENSLIYFNNNADLLFVKGLNRYVDKLKLINMLGQIILELKDVSSKSLENGLEISDLSSGAYVVYLETENITKIEKIIIN